MPRIVGVDIPGDKPVWISLMYLYGIGRKTSLDILQETGIDPNIRAKELTEEELARIASAIGKDLVIEGQLRRQEAQNIARLRDIGCYRGIRHRRGLTVRGQRTKTNARTRKGRRKTVAGKKGIKELKRG